MQYSSYHDLLIDEFDKRKQINSAYSLRAFARDMGLSAPRLSQVLSKKQGLSLDAAQDITEKLKLTENQKQWFFHSVGALHARGAKERDEFKTKIQKYKEEAKRFSEIHLEYFKVIADWYHFAILELTYLPEFQSDVKWIAGKLGIAPQECESAIERMKKLELMKEENGKLQDTFKFLATPSDVPSVSLKKFNSQLMKKAMEALYERDVLEREFSSNIFAFDKKDLPLFKEKIRDFRRELEQQGSRSKEKDSVYCLGIQFFELTKGGGEA